MPTERSFSEIFETLSEINFATNTSSHAAPEWESSLEPAWMSQLIAELSPIQYHPRPYLYRGYPVRKSQVFRQPHLFNEPQQTAYDTLAMYQTVGGTPSNFDQAFTKTQLKSAYRQALLKTHPDQGGTAETFQAVKKSYEILLVFVTKQV
jgi:hypothetical protein